MVLRRPLKGEIVVAQEDSGQQLLGFVEANRKTGKQITGYHYCPEISGVMSFNCLKEST